jgi:hypothetical protein
VRWATAARSASNASGLLCRSSPILGANSALLQLIGATSLFGTFLAFFISDFHNNRHFFSFLAKQKGEKGRDSAARSRKPALTQPFAFAFASGKYQLIICHYREKKLETKKAIAQHTKPAAGWPELRAAAPAYLSVSGQVLILLSVLLVNIEKCCSEMQLCSVRRTGNGR